MAYDILVRDMEDMHNQPKPRSLLPIFTVPFLLSFFIGKSMDLVRLIFCPIDCFDMTDDYYRFALSYFDIQITEKGLFCL